MLCQGGLTEFVKRFGGATGPERVNARVTGVMARLVIAAWGTPDILGSRVYRCARLRDVCRLLTPPVKEAE